MQAFREKSDSAKSPQVTGRKSRNMFGFTLIEVIVAVSIFTIVSGMALASLLTVIDSSVRTRSNAQVVDSLNFTLDDMTRRLRIGYGYNCGSSPSTNTTCSGSSDIVSFMQSAVNGSPQAVTYRLQGETIERQMGGGNFKDVTAPDVSIDTLDFYITTTAESGQPSVLIVVEGTVGEDNTARSFRVQTMATQRILYAPNI